MPSVNDARYVLDASALLCLFFREPGTDRVEAILDLACVSTVNYCEVVSKATELGVALDRLTAFLTELGLDIVPLDRETAELAGALRASTRAAGLSLGDRCCLALARRLGGVAVTTDRAWARVDAGVPVDVIR